MFQNITERIDEDCLRDSKIKLVLKEMLKKENILIYILTFLISSISINSEILPFGLAIIAACMGTTVPVFGVTIVAIVSTAIFHGSAGFSTFFYTTLLFFLMNLIFKPKVSLEERNEILLVGGKLFASCFIYSLIKNITGIFLVYDLFMGTVISSLTYVFYKIFVNGISVIRDFRTKKAFSIEEVIAATILLAIACSVLKGIKIFELEICNILIILLILILGLKNGMLIGGISGISIGLALMLINKADMMLLSILAVSGALAGFLNNFGRIGVVIGFVLGNAILTYLVTGNTVQVIYYREIFISSLFLIFIPSKFKINIEDIFPKEKMLTHYGEHRLKGYDDLKEKINTVVQTINNTVNKVPETMSVKQMKEEFVQDFLDNFEEYNSNIFYEDVRENEELIEEVYNTFLVEDIITEKIIIDIFKKHNNYILLRDEKIKNDLQELIKIMNQTFRVIQMKKVKAEIQREQKNKINSEMKNISKAISKVSDSIENEKVFDKKEKEIYILLKGKKYPINNIRVRQVDNGKMIITLNLDYKDGTIREKDKIANIADIISRAVGKKVVFQRDLKKNNGEEYNQIYASEDKFGMQIGSSKITKNESMQSGDSNLQIKLKDGKYVLAISDGMGSGEKARNASKYVIETLSDFLSDGFNEEETLNLINTNLNLIQENDMYASLDLNILDLYTGKSVMIKNGACNTYIKNKKNVSVYKSNNIPVGTVEKVKFAKEVVELKEDDIIVMCSDGVLEAKNELTSDWLEIFLKNVNTNNVQKIADLIVTETIDNSYGVAADDITVIVAKIIKRK